MPNRILKLQTVKKNPISFLALGNSLSYQDRNGTGTLTANGALRYAPGNGGRINLHPNPSAETGTTNIGPYGLALSISRVQAPSAAVVAGSWAYSVTKNANPGQTGIFVVASARPKAIAGATYTLSAYVYHELGSDRTFRTRLESCDASGTAISGTYGTFRTVPSGVLTRLSDTFTSAAGTEKINPVVFMENAGIGDVFYVDAILVEQASSAGDYFDGSAPGCAWADPVTGIAGTAHLSPSISRAAFWVEEATTNTVPDPSFEAASITTNWVSAGAAVISKVSTYAYLGSNAAKVSCGATNADGMTQLTTSGAAASSGQTWTASAYVRAFASGDIGKTVRLRISGRGAAGSFIEEVYSSGFTLSGTWQRISFTTTLANASTTSVICSVYNSGLLAVDFVVDAIQLEQKAYATSYCDGSLGTGYSWSGTAHGSASTRALAQVSGTTATRVSSLQGTAVVAFNKALDDNRFSAPLHLGIYGTNDWLGIAVRTNTVDDLIFRSKVGAASERSVAAGAFSYGAWHTAIGDWNTSTIGAQLDASARVSASRVDTPTGVMGSTLNIGYGGSAEVINGFVGPVALFDRPLTSTEVALLQATDPRYWWDLLGP